MAGGNRITFGTGLQPGHSTNPIDNPIILRPEDIYKNLQNDLDIQRERDAFKKKREQEQELKDRENLVTSAAVRLSRLNANINTATTRGGTIHTSPLGYTGAPSPVALKRLLGL